MKKTKNFLKYITTYYLLVALIFVVILATTIHVLAANPWPYAPGVTINPGCSPTDPTCIVSVPVDSLSSVLIAGNTTGANDISITSGNKIVSAADADNYMNLNDNNGDLVFNSSNDMFLNTQGSVVHIGSGSTAFQVDDGTLALGKSLSNIGLILFKDNVSNNDFEIEGPVGLASDFTWHLPNTQGGAGTVLTNDGSGNLSWTSGGGGTPTLTQNQIAYGDASNQMTSSPDLTFDGNDFKISTSSTYPDGFLEILDNGGQLKLGDYTNDFHGTYFQINDYVPSMKVYSTWPTFAGIQYNADYSANYTARSLIDKGYADSKYVPIGGHMITSGTTPSLGSCGSGSSSVVGTDTAGKITIGTGSPISCTLNFASSYSTPPVCTVTISDTAANGYEVTTSDSSLIISNIAVTENTNPIMYICVGE